MSESILKSVRQWVETVVVDLNLCPFAKRELVNDRVRFVATEANNWLDLLVALRGELEMLDTTPAIETTLLIHPGVLQDFDEYNQFLNAADDLLVEMEFEGIYQIASFHPDYQFAGTNPDDPENYTNRSPYPLLHLLREASLEQAIAEHPDVNEIPLRNIELMQQMGTDRLKALLQACVGDSN